MEPASSSAWYRHRWPWILMAGPLLVIVAGTYTTWLAARSFDGLVADDYYKRGLSVNQTIDRTDRAAALGLAAEIEVDRTRVRLVLLSTAGLAPSPAQVRLRFVHPTRAGLDRDIALARGNGGAYEGRIQSSLEGRWLVSVEADDWRLPPVEFRGGSAPIRADSAMRR